MTDTAATPELWTVAQVATYYRVSEATIYRLLKTRDLPHRRIGAQLRFDPGELDVWFSQQAKNGRQVTDPDA